MLLAVFFAVVSCGGGSKDSKSCPDGYKMSGGDCVKESGGDYGDTTIPDTEPWPDDGDTADDSDSEEQDSEENDEGDTGYNGSCTQIHSGDSFEINVETKKLKIGTITMNKSADITGIYGELWAEYKDTTLSEFKIGDINSELSGKTFNFPKGRYNFFYRSVSSANKIMLADNIDMESGDRTLDFDIPLYRMTGKVKKTADGSEAVDFTVEDAYQSTTRLLLKTGTFEKEIPYAEFGGYSVLLPKGTYSVYFEGQLAAGQGRFEGTAVQSMEIGGESADIAKDIEVKTITFSGSITKTGYPVNAGQLVLVENPSLGGPINGTVASDISTASSYAITVTTGASLNLLYLPSADSYPSRYINVDPVAWNSETEKSHNISLDFGRVHGKITFLGGNDFPTVSKCSEADCTIGKLKAAKDDGSGIPKESYLLVNLGTDLTLHKDDEGNVVYEGLLLRSQKFGEQSSEKKYILNFESNLNDIKDGFSPVMFTVPAKYVNGEGKKVSTFSFAVTESDGTKTFLDEKNLDLDIAPTNIRGMVSLNDSPYSTERTDFIKLKGEDGTEHIVMNLSELSGGMFNFYVPAGSYDVIYEGSGILSKNFKTYIDRDFEVEEEVEIANAIFAMKTGKITLDLNVNGIPLSKWFESQKKENRLDSLGFAVNIDKTASDFVLELEKKDDKFVAEVLTGSTVNAFLELVFNDKVDSEKSYARIPLLSSKYVDSGTTVKKDLSLIDFSMSVKLNGKSVSATDYAAKFRILGTYPTEIYCPAEGSVVAFMHEREYNSPVPELYLNEGFDAVQKILLPCVYFGK